MISGLLSAIAGGVASTDLVRKLVYRILKKELKEKIALLQSVPIPVAEHFAKLIEPVEKRSAKHDYLLFMAGVIVTTIIAIVLQIGLGK